MVRNLAKKSPWQEDGRCGKKQGRNEIVGGGAWLSCEREVLQQLDFSNPISPDDVMYFYAELVVALVLLSFGPRLIRKIH
ncbi:hypothetical protein TIFTF001_007853 [Ficus carica]|uniref:Uncharacterized protein n=1 Tax=Ficus carica TaxID=3494 RepID=A0AA87ZR51_FICCA|nr:hypothetical protein TIFTF001_007853 [Ficus carica]